MADLAKLMARLAEPFAKPEEILRHANVTHASLDAAKKKWVADLKGNEMLARLYGEIYLRERAELRGEPRRVPRVAAAVDPVHAQPVAISVDETAALTPQLTLGQVMPFVEGKFEPPVAPVQPREERPFDPDGTQLAPMIDGDTLPSFDSFHPRPSRNAPERSRMKKRAHRQGDGSICTKEGQDGPAVGGAADVFVNGRPVTRLGDGGLYPPPPPRYSRILGNRARSARC